MKGTHFAKNKVGYLRPCTIENSRHDEYGRVLIKFTLCSTIRRELPSELHEIEKVQAYLDDEFYICKQVTVHYQHRPYPWPDPTPSDERSANTPPLKLSLDYQQ